MAEAPAPAPSAEDELATKILRQVEYYFSDDSYPFDDYIKSQEKDGWVPLTVIAAFKKMVSYTTDLDVIRTALKASDALDLDEQGDNLRRRFVTPDKDPHKERIVHASGFGVDGGKEAVETNIGKALERSARRRGVGNLSQDGRCSMEVPSVLRERRTRNPRWLSGCVISGRKIGLMASVDCPRRKKARVHEEKGTRRAAAPSRRRTSGLRSAG